jgi:hypothetical protein
VVGLVGVLGCWGGCDLIGFPGRFVFLWMFVFGGVVAVALRLP